MSGLQPGSSGAGTITKTGGYSPQPSTPPIGYRPSSPPPPPPAAAAAPAPASLTTPDLSGNNWKAYLTPDQTAAMNTLANNTSNAIGADQRKIGDAQDAYGRNDAQAAYTHDNNISNANNAAAGRGMFLSSVRDNQLTDINRTLVDYRAGATANLNSLINDTNASISNLSSNWNTAVLGYEGDAASQVPTPVAGPGAPPAAPAAPGPVNTNPAGGFASPNVIRAPLNNTPNRSPIAPPKAGPFGASGGGGKGGAGGGSILGSAVAGHSNW